MLAMTNPASRDLRTLPKGHLHVHLEGAMRPTTLSELAGTAGIPVPEIRGYGSFSAFSRAHGASCHGPLSPGDFPRLGLGGVGGSRPDGAGRGGPSVYRPPCRER